MTAGQLLAVLEAMKMELEVVAPVDGVIRRSLVLPGRSLSAGQLMLTVAP